MSKEKNVATQQLIGEILTAREIDRLGEGMIPDRETVIQEGDLLHLVMREENAERVYEVFNNGPEAD